jgi:hypothetical protein
VTVDDVKNAAHQYLAAHPEISEAESYQDIAAVEQLRDGVLQILAAQGIRGGKVMGPDGKPYYQLVAIGNPTDPQATVYRVTAGGGPIRRAIEVAYSDGPIDWSGVH